MVFERQCRIKVPYVCVLGHKTNPEVWVRVGGKGDLYFYIRHIVAVNYHTRLWYDAGRPLKRVWFRWGYKIDLCFHANKTRGTEATIILTFSWITFLGSQGHILNPPQFNFNLIPNWHSPILHHNSLRDDVFYYRKKVSLMWLHIFFMITILNPISYKLEINFLWSSPWSELLFLGRVVSNFDYFMT